MGVGVFMWALSCSLNKTKDFLGKRGADIRWTGAVSFIRLSLVCNHTVIVGHSEEQSVMMSSLSLSGMLGSLRTHVGVGQTPPPFSELAWTQILYRKSGRKLINFIPAMHCNDSRYDVRFRNMC